jgi:hypothetical protein
MECYKEKMFAFLAVDVAQSNESTSSGADSDLHRRGRHRERSARTFRHGVLCQLSPRFRLARQMSHAPIKTMGME